MDKPALPDLKQTFHAISWHCGGEALYYGDISVVTREEYDGLRAAAEQAERDYKEVKRINRELAEKQFKDKQRIAELEKEIADEEPWIVSDLKKRAESAERRAEELQKELWDAESAAKQGYITDCEIYVRNDEVTLITNTRYGVIPRLHKYALVPLEQFHELKARIAAAQAVPVPTFEGRWAKYGSELAACVAAMRKALKGE